VLFQAYAVQLTVIYERPGVLMSDDNQPHGVSGIALGTFEIFSKLDAKARDDIAQETHLRSVDKGQYIISAQTADTDVYFLISGCVRACSFTHNGKQIHFDELSPGMMFGELSAIDGKERSSACISVSTCNLAVMKASHFKEIIMTHPSVCESVMQRLASMVRDNMQRVYEFSALTVPQRIRCELLRLASNASHTSAKDSDTDIHLESAPTHAEIAARISTHREAVTRELKTLESQGIITWKPKKYVIHDITYLSEMEVKPDSP